MADPILFKITEAGKLAALNADADAANLQVRLVDLAVGTGSYVATGNEIALVTETGRSGIVSGDVEVASNTLRFSSTMTATAITPIYELGLFTDDNVLFAIASSGDLPLVTLYPNVSFIMSFGLSLLDISASIITIVNDPNAAQSVVLMQNHLASPDPHPQYLNNNRFQMLLNALIPIGYLHHTHIPQNPKPLFDELLGIDTHWRRLVGRIMIASDPNDPFINDYGITLGQKGLTTLAGDTRPHIYPLQTTHVYERFDPSAVIATVWTVKSSKVAIGEGEAVRFTVSANNLPDGQILNWSAKEGLLNAESNDIDAPEKTESGTSILKDGQFFIDFTTTPDDNEIEELKYVRLTVGAPASLDINIPIADKGFNETVVYIQESTTNGISLDDFYKAQTGSYSLITDRIRFIIGNNVDIIALNTSTPALQDGLNWLEGTQIIVENRGRILGRGGNAGQSAFCYRTEPLPAGMFFEKLPEKGGDGGTAIKGAITVYNYGLIAGGGGGGGGAGSFYYSDYGNDYGGSDGDSAPLGRRYPNPKTYEHYSEELSGLFADIYPLPPSKHPTTNRSYDNYSELVFYPTSSEHPSFIRGEIFSGNPLYSEIIDIPANFGFLRNTSTTFVIPDYTDATKTNYRLYSWAGSSNRGWVGGFRQSSHATVDNKGLGGLSLQAPLSGSGTLLRLSNLAGLDITKNKGGDGGGHGENGSASLLGEFYSGGKAGDPTPFKVSKASVSVIKEPKAGGLAGFISEGAVTINNIASGTTKGRIAP